MLDAERLFPEMPRAVFSADWELAVFLRRSALGSREDEMDAAMAMPTRAAKTVLRK
jgi:hypothetical protein